jgi:hypothetical protein
MVAASVVAVYGSSSAAAAAAEWQQHIGMCENGGCAKCNMVAGTATAATLQPQAESCNLDCFCSWFASVL